MKTSVAWINEYLDRPASADEQADLLTRAGFPLEEREEVEVSTGVDVRQEYEMTSNRGDCVCHLGLARELAALSERTLVPPRPELAPIATPATDFVEVLNEDPAGCPLYTARIIRGVKIGPSPAWLADRLRARGDVPRNNVVDATNFVLFELGQPTHVFDLATLRGGKIIIRAAHEGEPFLPIGDGEPEVKLSSDDLVIADAERAVAIGGVKGGALTAVSDSTTDVLLEAATFDPVRVRTTSRRLGIASDSSYRYERGVHPAQVSPAAERLAALIIQLAGGELCTGVVSGGAAIPEPRVAHMRPDRARKILGVDLPDERILGSLDRLGFAPKIETTDSGARVSCTVPTHRLDIEREIDLIEEVGRMLDLNEIPVDDAIRIRVAPPQPTEEARRAVGSVLTGLEFVETITDTLMDERAAQLFLPADLTPLRVDDERAKDRPILRPSLIPSLLRVCRHNADHGTKDVRLYESAATFARTTDGHLETHNLAFLHPADGPDPLRTTRGIIERLLTLLRGPDARLDVVAHDAFPWFAPGAAAMFEGGVLGTYGLIADDVRDHFGLEGTWAAAELGLPALYDVYPPDTSARPLPAFPSIERDLSIVVDEPTAWSAICATIDALELDLLDAVEFVTVFRGKQIPEGRKSVSLRLCFRRDDRTLTHDEVDPQVERTVAALRDDHDAELRT